MGASTVGQAQDGAQLSLSLESVQFVAIPDMPAVHEQLRQGGPAGACANLRATGRVTVEANFTEDRAVTIEQRASPRAVPAP